MSRSLNQLLTKQNTRLLLFLGSSTFTNNLTNFMPQIWDLHPFLKLLNILVHAYGSFKKFQRIFLACSLCFKHHFNEMNYPTESLKISVEVMNRDILYFLFCLLTISQLILHYHWASYYYMVNFQLLLSDH